MNYFINKIINLIYAKRKQILFALFAFLYIIDNDSPNILKSAAPAIVAGAAKVGAAAGKAAETGVKVAGKAAETGVKTAGKAAETGVKAAGKAAETGVKTAGKAAETGAKTTSNTKKNFDTAKQMGNANEMLKQKNEDTLNRSTPRNTNPKLSLSPGKLTSSLQKNSIPSAVGARNFDFDKMNKAAGFPSLDSKIFNPFESSQIEDEEEDDVIMERASKQVLKKSPALIISLILGGMLVFVSLVPLMFLGVVNATNTTLSQIDCTKQQGDNCKVEDTEESFFNKLKNLFTYGAYGSNSEVVLKEFNDSYDKIKEEYDFVISMSLLSSSMFSDSKYIESNTENGQIVITDDMLERSQYIYDMAMLQLIPRYNIYTCESRLVDSLYNIYEYIPTYQNTLIPTYDEGDTTEIDVEIIPTGVCDASTAGGQFKSITYYHDAEKYFKRLMNSEELDLVYKDFVDADKLLVSKISNQYYIYQKIYNVDEELSYLDVPVQLTTDESVIMQSPLKGWYAITSPFGIREGEYAGMHTGIDLVASDKNIYAAGKGIVTRSNVETEGGNVIEITHTDSTGREYVTQYAHLSSRHVNVGDVVNAGDVIGIMGDTGTMASGVHLHFAMWDKETKEYYNPRKLFGNADNY